MDVGTGSGILALCAAKLGAKDCFACDIDPVAVRVARENVKEDGAENITLEVSDLLQGVDTGKGLYDVVLANLVADIVLRLLPDLPRYMPKGGKAIFSGIIGERVPAVREALKQYGFTVSEEAVERDWYAILAEKD